MGDKFLAATELLNESDPTLLTSKEITKGFGSPFDFFLCYGLKPWNCEDCEAARGISRALKEAGGDVSDPKERVCYQPSLLVKHFEALKEVIIIIIIIIIIIFFFFFFFLSSFSLMTGWRECTVEASIFKNKNMTSS